MFEHERLDAARYVLKNAGSPAETDAHAALAVFTVGLGVLSGHYNELLAERLRDAHLQAFGPEGPTRFRDAELAAALLDGDPPGNGGEQRMH